MLRERIVHIDLFNLIIRKKKFRENSLKIRLDLEHGGILLNDLNVMIDLDVKFLLLWLNLKIDFI